MSRKNGQRFTATTGAPYNREKQVKKVDYWPFWAYPSSDIYIKAKLFFRRLRHYLSSFFGMQIWFTFRLVSEESWQKL